MRGARRGLTCANVVGSAVLSNAVQRDSSSDDLARARVALALNRLLAAATAAPVVAVVDLAERRRGER